MLHDSYFTLSFIASKVRALRNGEYPIFTRISVSGLVAEMNIARHTFATVSLNNHVPIETISKMLGHADIRTTQIYAKMLDSTVYKDMAVMRNKFDCVMMN